MHVVITNASVNNRGGLRATPTLHYPRSHGPFNTWDEALDYANAILRSGVPEITAFVSPVRAPIGRFLQKQVEVA